MSELQYIYIAKFSHGAPDLVRATVARTTPKMFYLEKDSQVDILGCLWVGSQIPKSRCFDSEPEALRWPRSRAIKYVTGCQREVTKAQSQVAVLDAMIAAEE